MNRTTAFRAAAIASLLVVAAASADETSSTMIAYTVNGFSSSDHRTWNGTTWSGASTTPAYADWPKSCVLRNCPTRDEMALAFVDNSNFVFFLIHDGISWGAVNEISPDTDGIKDQRPYDVTYERKSGDMLVVAYDKVNLKRVAWQTWDGTSLSAKSYLTLPSDKKLKHASLYPKSRSDEVFLVALNDDKDLYACLWDGDAWGAVSTLELDTGYKDEAPFSLAWERQSGDALLVYGENGMLEPRYRTWDGTAWSAEMLAPSVGKKQRWIRLAADTASNEILLATLDDDKDVNVNVWDGSSWGTNLEIDDELQERNGPFCDIVYEKGGGEAIVAYAEKDALAPTYRTWDGTSWSAPLTGASIGQKMRTVTLTTGSEDDEVWITTLDDQKDVNVARWDGTSWSAATEVTAEHTGAEKAIQQRLAVPQDVSGYRIIQWVEVDPGG